MTEDIAPNFHVVSLRYKLEHGENVTFNNPPPVELDTEEAELQLKGGILFCKLKTHYGTKTEACAAIEPILRAWELDASIRRNLYGLRFKFEKAEIIDRTPIVPGKPKTFVHVGGVSAVALGESVTVRVGWAKYPDPPLTFRVTPDVESLWLRYKGYIDGHEPLLAMGYFCFTLLKTIAGGNSKVMATYLGTDVKVLRKLSELTSKRGDRTTARKVQTLILQPLSATETTWISAVLKVLILRLGDTRPINSLKKITMADFPSL